MRRTAKHVLSSSNPVQLETRILANHGNDRRFAFLRGRWKTAWRTIKLLVREEQIATEREKPSAKSSALAGLGGYGDSEDEDGSAVDDSDQPQVYDELILARQARAREWIAKRKGLKSQEQSS